MAEIDSVQYAAVSAGTPETLDPVDLSGRVETMYANKTTPVGVAQNDTLNLFTPEKGRRWKGGDISWEAQGASVTIAVGISGDTDKFLEATDASAKGTARMTHVDGVDYEFDGATDVIVTLAGGNPTDEKIIKAVAELIGNFL